VSFTIEPDCQIHPTATINVQHGFIGSGTIISANVTIEGTLVEIGREAFLDKGAIILLVVHRSCAATTSTSFQFYPVSQTHRN
jgi:UDP-3-O-[3-hydroxymyristoyl] glucosamine N-acyltransferase